jgi:hypothetical protein
VLVICYPHHIEKFFFHTEIPSSPSFPVQKVLISFNHPLLPKVEIAVYKVKSPIGIGEKSLAADFGNEPREVARLKRINIKTLPQRSQKEIRNVLR